MSLTKPKSRQSWIPVIYLYSILLVVTHPAASFLGRLSVLDHASLALGEGSLGHPSDALARAGNLRVQLVDLLERVALSLVDKEIDERDGE